MRVSSRSNSCEKSVARTRRLSRMHARSASLTDPSHRYCSVDSDAKAEQLLAQTRAALGGEKNMSKVQGLTCSGTYERTMGDRQLSNEMTIDLQLPDKMLRTESINPVGDMTIVVEQGINGETL